MSDSRTTVPVTVTLTVHCEQCPAEDERSWRIEAGSLMPLPSLPLGWVHVQGAGAYTGVYCPACAARRLFAMRD